MASYLCWERRIYLPFPAVLSKVKSGVDCHFPSKIFSFSLPFSKFQTHDSDYCAMGEEFCQQSRRECTTFIQKKKKKTFVPNMSWRNANNSTQLNLQSCQPTMMRSGNVEMKTHWVSLILNWTIIQIENWLVKWEMNNVSQEEFVYFVKMTIWASPGNLYAASIHHCAPLLHVW